MDNFSESRAGTLGFFIYYLNLLPVVVIGEYFFNEDGIPPIYLPSRCGYRSTEKIGSQREKLSLKTYRIPRVGLDKKFGSFFIYAIFFPFSLTSGIKTKKVWIIAFLRAVVAPAGRQINYSEVFQNEKSSILNHQRKK